jgi:hypothetical protein
VWILLPGLAAVGAAILSWFVTQSRMDVALARERERLAEERGQVCEQRGEIRAERSAMEAMAQAAVKAAEEVARRQALEEFLGELHVEQRRFTREIGTRWKPSKALVLQERMSFRGIPLSGWIEHQAALEQGADVERLASDMTVFESGVVNIASIPRAMRALGAAADSRSASR